MVEESWPKLSETLPMPRHPESCQACGRRWDGLSRWMEHDEGDFATFTVVVLCERCAGRIIEPHPRLYARLDPDEHQPGSMDLCIDCRHRDGLTCDQALANGGPGVRTFPVPTRMHLLTSPRRHSGWHTLWRPAESCTGREVSANVEAGS